MTASGCSSYTRSRACSEPWSVATTSSLVADARTRVARLQGSPDDDAVRPTATREDQALVAFAPPPSGHKDWLDVELPGL